MLKSIRDGLSKREDLDYWDQKFAEIAESYWLYRARYMTYVREMMPAFPTFFAKYAPEFHYESSVDNSNQWSDSWDQCDQKADNEIIVEYLRANRERDILTGHTHIGPHRDDWGFRLIQNWIPSIPVESYLSRGEMKMLLLGLKIIERHFISTTLDLPVILLIDDIFAELDENNSDIFLSSLMQYQVILTSQKPLPNHEKYHDFACINLGND